MFQRLQFCAKLGNNSISESHLLGKLVVLGVALGAEVITIFPQLPQRSGDGKAVMSWAPNQM